MPASCAGGRALPLYVRGSAPVPRGCGRWRFFTAPVWRGSGSAVPLRRRQMNNGASASECTSLTASFNVTVRFMFLAVAFSFYRFLYGVMQYARITP